MTSNDRPCGLCNERHYPMTFVRSTGVFQQLRAVAENIQKNDKICRKCLSWMRKSKMNPNDGGSQNSQEANASALSKSPEEPGNITALIDRTPLALRVRPGPRSYKRKIALAKPPPAQSRQSKNSSGTSDDVSSQEVQSNALFYRSSQSQRSPESDSQQQAVNQIRRTITGLLEHAAIYQRHTGG